MKTLIAALLLVVTSCATVPENYVVHARVAEYIPAQDESEESIISNQLMNGQISEGEALEALEALNPHLFSLELDEKFFPADIITQCTIIGIDDENPMNCAYDESYGWNIECDVSPFYKCRISITCPIRFSPYYGTWVFTKECDGQPIGTWTLDGLYVHYDTMQRIW